MRIFAISDLHLSFEDFSFTTQYKPMDVFGDAWKDHTKHIETAWKTTVCEEDLILIAGDISWAMNLEQAQPDLAWIHRLPGKKLLLKGNHDYWWPSSKKLADTLPTSMTFIHGNSFSYGSVTIGGSRLWDVPGVDFSKFIAWKENGKKREEKEVNSAIFVKELQRLEQSLKTLSPDAKTRIAMTHFPPIGGDEEETVVSKLLEAYKINFSIFGHLHQVKKQNLAFGAYRGIEYLLTSSDYLNHCPYLLPIQVIT